MYTNKGMSEECYSQLLNSFGNLVLCEKMSEGRLCSSGGDYLIPANYCKNS